GVTRHGLPIGARIGDPRRRLAITWIVALVTAGLLVARLVNLQVSPSDRLLAMGEDQVVEARELVATRGSIVDRNGADLAISIPQTTVIADASMVVDPVGDAARLAPILGRDQATLQQLLSSGKKFVYLARQVEDDVADAVAALDLPYIELRPEDERYRPSGDRFALSVIGLTDIDQKPQSGIEQRYDDVLAGRGGRLVVEQDPRGRTIPGGEHEVEPAIPGSDVVLTIDRGLQFEIERLLVQAVDDAQAAGGTVLVSDVATGEILADANVARPLLETDEATGDENDGVDRDDEPVYGPARPSAENRAVSWTYEPGSVNKVITMAGVLEEGLATPDTVRAISSSLEVYDKRFAQESRSTDEDLSLRQILARSDNLGTIAWAQDLGEQRLHDYLRRFGLGTTTGLGLKGESSGRLPHVDTWSGTSLPTIAIGQGIAVTPLQMLGVYNTIANGGVYVPPRLVLGFESPDGAFHPETTGTPRRVVSEATAAALRDMLTAVVREGTGQRAQVNGFTVAGKTGTAWEPVEGGGYGEPGNRHLVTSFVGFLPANEPKLSILVVLDDPADPYATGGSLAAPLFQRVASYAVGHLRLQPDQQPAAADGERVRAVPQAAPTTTTSAPPTATAR
ncbi:MAG TPA: penicillin-binding protein 2, partial [Acidimicrobiales bacterium]